MPRLAAFADQVGRRDAHATLDTLDELAEVMNGYRPDWRGDATLDSEAQKAAERLFSLIPGLPEPVLRAMTSLFMFNYR